MQTPKDDKKKESKKENHNTDKAQRARTFLEAEFDDAVAAMKLQVTMLTARALGPWRCTIWTPYRQRTCVSMPSLGPGADKCLLTA